MIHELIHGKKYLETFFKKCPLGTTYIERSITAVNVIHGDKG